MAWALRCPIMSEIVPDYKPQTIEKKWQERWQRERAFEVTEDDPRPKFYCLEMFAYPSGHAHVGHVRNYMIGDVVARMKRMRGFNVLHPFGWDAFGLPAENAAIKGGMHPETWTLENIAHMKGQLQRIGISYAWDREVATCLPDYYHWNQWLFLKMLERDLAFRKRSNVNWCPSCNTVLANEQVVDGGCWRCGTPVTTRELEQWFFRITHYADELLEAADRLPGWPDKVLTMQRNWIGRSEGARVRFELALDGDPGLGIRDSGPGSGLLTGKAASESEAAIPSPIPEPRRIEVFTTRIDTIYGANFLMLAPEHPLVQKWSKNPAQPGLRGHAQAISGSGPHGADDGRSREGRIRYRPNGDQPVHESASADLGRELRPRRVRHGRRDGCAGARSTRLRVRSKVQAAHYGSGSG